MGTSGAPAPAIRLAKGPGSGSSCSGTPFRLGGMMPGTPAHTSRICHGIDHAGSLIAAVQYQCSSLLSKLLY